MNFIERMEKIIKEKSLLTLKEEIVLQEFQKLDEKYELAIAHTFEDKPTVYKGILKKDKFFKEICFIQMKNEMLEIKLYDNFCRKFKFKDYKEAHQFVLDYENGKIWIDDNDNVHVDIEKKKNSRKQTLLLDEIENLLSDNKIGFYKHEYNHQSKEQTYNIGFDKLIIKNGDTLIIETEDRQRKEIPTDDIYILPSLFSEV